MRNRNTLRALFATAAAATVLAAAGSASAITMTVFNTDLPIPAGQVMVENFDDVNATGGEFTFVGGPNTFVRDGDLGLWENMSAPPPGDTTNYFTVLGGGSATLNSVHGMTSFSFYLGSPDTYNFVKFTDFGGNTVTLQGSQIWNATSGDNGDQSWGRRVNYEFDTAIKSVEFSSTGNSFEFDTLAAAPAPEPATWAMMITGFAGAGAMLRRRRTAASLA